MCNISEVIGINQFSCGLGIWTSRELSMVMARDPESKFSHVIHTLAAYSKRLEGYVNSRIEAENGTQTFGFLLGYHLMIEILNDFYK